MPALCRAAYAEQQAEAAGLARLELAEVQQAARAHIEHLQQELRSAEAQLQAGGHSATPGASFACSSASFSGWSPLQIVEWMDGGQTEAFRTCCGAGTVDQPGQSISLRQLQDAQQPPPSHHLTVFHSAPSSPGAVSDVFGSPQQQPQQHLPHPESGAAAAGQQVASGGSASFQFQPLLGPEQQQGGGGGGAHDDDGASSSGDTDDTVSEAAVVARTMRRAGAQGRDEVQVR